MRSRRIQVAVEEVANASTRVLHRAVSSDGPVPKNAAGRGVYWCAADAPEVSEGIFEIRAIYRTTTVPADARCEDCGVRIRELQDMMSEL